MTTTEDVLRYTSNSHAKTLLRGLYRLRLTHELHDIWLCVGSQRFAAHKNVLAAASDYFNAMFLGGLAEVDKDCVEIHGILPDVFKILLEFMYTGDIEVTVSNCQDVLVASDMLRLSDVMEACCTFLKQQLHPSNCIGIFLFAECHNCEPLSQASESYIHAHFIAVTEEDEYLDLSKDILVRILQSENLLIENEVQVFQAAMKWIEHNVSLRRRCVFDVLAPVRFPIVSCKQLYSHMEQCGDLSLKIALRKLMQDFYGSQWQPYERHIGQLKPYLLQPRKCARKNMYVVGGYSRDPGGRWSDSRSLATVECFNSFQQQWTKLASLRHSRSGHGIAILDGCIYVVGGESDSLIFDNTECFSPATQKWTTIPSMTVPRCGLGVCVCHNKIYAIGGWIGAQIGDTVERFDPELNRWIEVDRVQTLRFAMGVIEYKGLVYVVGGMSELGTEMKCVESYNPVTQEWCQLSPMLTNRAYIALAALDGCLYALGGWNEDDGALSTVEKYSIEENSWMAMATLLTCRAGATATAVNGLLYVIGGRTSNGQSSAPTTLETVECYDPQTDCWFYVKPMPTSRCEATVVVL